jgi:hypothetical protein
MSWNHRVLAHKDGNDWFFQIHEVYYDNQHVPNGYTENPVTVGGESLDAVRWVLDNMKDCVDKPILSAENFPNEWEPDNQ